MSVIMLKRIGFAVLAITSLAASARAAQRLSPHDEASVALGDHKVTITYGRPYLKGRKAVGGSLVPYDQVWRLGADEATKLTTDADLMIGTLRVPKGSYALFTIASQDHWTLIVNKKADQWGAFDYNQSDDLGRTPLVVTHLSSPVEQFTITLKPKSDDSAALHLTWESTDASTTISLAK